MVVSFLQWPPAQQMQLWLPATHNGRFVWLLFWLPRCKSILSKKCLEWRNCFSQAKNHLKIHQIISVVEKNRIRFTKTWRKHHFSNQYVFWWFKHPSTFLGRFWWTISHTCQLDTAIELKTHLMGSRTCFQFIIHGGWLCWGLTVVLHRNRTLKPQTAPVFVLASQFYD